MFSPDKFPWVLWPLWAILSLAFVAYVIKTRKERGANPVFPAISPNRILYQENFASGRSLEDGITRLGGARNCLKLVLTKDELWVTPWFFPALFAGPYDLVHRIPKQKVLSIREVSSFFRGRCVQIQFTRPNGKTCTLELAPRKVDDFLRVLDINAGTA